MSAKRFVLVNGQMQKTPGWFSWRHETRDAHDAAVLLYLQAHKGAAKRKNARARLASLSGKAAS